METTDDYEIVEALENDVVIMQKDNNRLIIKRSDIGKSLEDLRTSISKNNSLNKVRRKDI